LQQRPEFQVTVLPKRLSEAELLPLVSDVVAMIVRSETKVTKKINQGLAEILKREGFKSLDEAKGCSAK